MKSFLQFISEAETQASTQAKNMGLSGDGHGDWYDKQGKLVAWQEALDFILALPMKLVSVSFGSGKLKSLDESSSKSIVSRIDLNSSTFTLL